MKIVIVDDEKSIVKSLTRILKRYGHEVFPCNSVDEVFSITSKNVIHLILSDMNMPGKNGIDLLKEINNQTIFKDIVTIIFTAYGNVSGAVEAMKLGAYEYLLKPIDINELELTLKKIEDLLNLKKENYELTKNFNEKLEQSTKKITRQYDDLRIAYTKTIGLDSIGIFSSKMKEVYNIASRFHINPDIPVLIEGETGTGKEVLAKYIHYGDKPETTPFVDLNCASISPSLFESELFGYEPGAYTGGKKQGQIGKIELAGNGTLFLDEIGELPQEYQAKLLRLIEEKAFYKVGGLKKIKVNARIICATNKKMKNVVENGEFRKDLFYRLSTGYIQIPPLRKRKDEILKFTTLFLQEFRKTRKSSFMEVSQEARKILINLKWDGNIRELKNLLERVVTLYDDEILMDFHLDQIINLTKPSKSKLIPNYSDAEKKKFNLPDNSFDLNNHIAEIIVNALKLNRHNKTKTAKYLSISRGKLYWYLEQFNINL